MTAVLNGSLVGGGGGSSLPVTDFADVLAGATPSQIAATDSGGNGTLLTFSDALYASRRLAADASTPLLWECDGASGSLVNTGSLGASGNLTAGGSCVRNALSPRSTIGRGIRGNGSASGGATGAVGLVPSGAGQSFTACVTFVVLSWPGGSVPLLAMDAAPTWVPPYLAFRIALSLGGVVQAEVSFATGGHPTPYASGYGPGQHQAVATYDGTYFRLYVDGELVATSAVPGSGDIQWGSGPWCIAAQGDSGGFDGYVTRAQVDAVVWSADRVAQEWVRTIGNCT